MDTGLSLGLLLSVVGTSAAVSTAFATGVTLYLRFRDKPAPDWVIDGHASRPDPEQRPTATGSEIEITANVVNAGDGRAFRVILGGSKSSFFHRVDGGQGRQRLPVQDTLLSVVEPGDSQLLWITTSDELWSAAEITLQWTQSPTRKGKRVTQHFRLAESFVLPEPRE